MDMSSSSGVVAVEDRSALSSQLSAGDGLPGPLPVTGAGSGAAVPWSTCILSSGAVTGELEDGAGGPQEGTNEGALTLGTKDAALTLRASILLLTSMPSSQLSGAPLVAISCSGAVLVVVTNTGART